MGSGLTPTLSPTFLSLPQAFQPSFCTSKVSSPSPFPVVAPPFQDSLPTGTPSGPGSLNGQLVLIFLLEYHQQMTLQPRHSSPFPLLLCSFSLCFYFLFFLSSLRSLFLHITSSYYLCVYISTCRAPFSISYREGLVILKSFQFCSAENVLISSLLLVDSFPAYRILGWQISPNAPTTHIQFECISPLWLWLSKFLMKHLLIILSMILCM